MPVLLIAASCQFLQQNVPSVQIHSLLPISLRQVEVNQLHLVRSQAFFASFFSPLDGA